MWQIHDRDRAQPNGNNTSLRGDWALEGADASSRGEHGGGWTCYAAGGAAGIEFGDRAGTLRLSVANVGDEVLPLAGEQYVCGDAWKMHFPQTTGQFSMRLSVRVVHATATRIIWEPTFSIQTSLLDTAPSLALTSRGEPDARVAKIASELTSRVSVCACRGPEGGQLIVLLGPNDAPLAKDRCCRTRLDLRIFGDFLEKGVIRKSRPWIVIDRSDDGVSKEDLADYCTRLCETPLPLTA